MPLVDLRAVHEPLELDLRAAFERVLASSCFVGGAEVEHFEAALAAQTGAAHAVAVGSGTSALHLALRAAGIGTGDEVVLPPNTFFATAEAVVAAGATAVLADVDPGSALLDPAAVESAITSRTAAIVAVHLYGQPFDADRFGAVAERHGLFLLEDAAQALGGSWRSRPVGSMGDAAAFSFYPGKNLGALGDGGAVTTGDLGLAQQVRLLRSHGEQPRSVHLLSGFCDRLDELQAAFLSAKLPHLAVAQRARVQAVARYQGLLTELGEVQPLEVAGPAGHAHHLLVVQVPRRDAVLRALHGAGIGASVHYRTPIHLQPAWKSMGKPGQFPEAERLARSVLSLPLYPSISSDQIDRCVQSLRQAMEATA
ncbi:MAG: DegT/DnrJ/EryC1/StrS family aminotransferase [Acidimicrobiales bacterium]